MLQDLPHHGAAYTNEVEWRLFGPSKTTLSCLTDLKRNAEVRGPSLRIDDAMPQVGSIRVDPPSIDIYAVCCGEANWT
jgi:hypothetical protein